MKRVYWKIFLWFWLAMVLAIVIIAWLSAQFTQQDYLPFNQRTLISNYGVTAVITYEIGHETALRQWFDELSERFNMRAYLFANDGKEVLGRSLSGKMIKVQQEMASQELPYYATREGDLIISPVIRGRDGREYRFVAQKPFNIRPLAQIPFSDFLWGLLIAAILAGLVCYVLSIYLTKPIRVLQDASRQLALGDLSTRVSDRLKKHNEIAELAYEFDHMAERLQQILTLQQRLLHAVSHELRSPLARLQIALELVRKKLGHGADKELNRIELEAERLNGLIGQILSLAQLEGEQYVLHKSPIDLAHLLEEIKQDIRFEDQTSGDRIKLDNIEQGTIAHVDAPLFRSALENIIRNALKYSPETKPIQVQLKSSNIAGIKISVRDFGQGVPIEKLPHLFKAFYRVDDARLHHKQGGYGLGLAIADRIIQLHNGSVSAENHPESGMIVSILLPSNNNK